MDEWEIGEAETRNENVRQRLQSAFPSSVRERPICASARRDIRKNCRIVIDGLNSELTYREMNTNTEVTFTASH